MKYRILLKRIITLTFLQVVILVISITARAGNNGNATMVMNKKPRFTSINQADISITGKVTDEKTKSPIPGVSVKVKNGTTTAVTDENGVYKISVPNEQTVLLFSYIGYDVQEVAVGNLKNVNVILK